MASPPGSSLEGVEEMAHAGKPTIPPRRRPVTPGTKKATVLPPLPPLTPFVTTVSAKVLNEAEKKLESLRVEVEELKRKDKERDQKWKLVRQTAIDPADLDVDDATLTLERERLQREMAVQYTMQREQMHKRLQKAFFEEQSKRERQQVRFSGSIENKDEEGEFNSRSRNSSIEDVLVVTLDKVPGSQLIESLGPIKAIVPRSRLIDDDTPEELAHGLQLAKIVRREAYERMRNIARKRGANAIVNFEYKTRTKPKDEDDDDDQYVTVEIMACGLACVLRKIVPERERQRGRELEQQQQLRRKDREIGTLQNLLGRQQKAQSDRYQRCMGQDELVLMLQGFHDKAQHAQRFNGNGNGNGRLHEDRQAAMLRSLLGPKVSFADEGRSAAFFDGPGPSRTNRTANSRSVEDALLAALASQGLSEGTLRRTATDWNDAYDGNAATEKEEKAIPAEEEKEFAWSLSS